MPQLASSVGIGLSVLPSFTYSRYQPGRVTLLSEPKSNLTRISMFMNCDRSKQDRPQVRIGTPAVTSPAKTSSCSTQGAALFQVDEKQRHRSGCYTGDAPRPGQRIGSRFAQLLLHLVGESINLLVIHIGGQRGVLKAAQTVNFILLTIDVARIFSLNRNLLGHLLIGNGLTL